MILTEEEARTKWCPFARLGQGFNRLLLEPQLPIYAKCLASGCMAWRTVDDGSKVHYIQKPALYVMEDTTYPESVRLELRRQYEERHKEALTKGWRNLDDTRWRDPNDHAPTGCCGLADRDVVVERDD